MVELILQYFRIKRSELDKDYHKLCRRQKEYTECLKKNLKYNIINKIHILLEDEEAFTELISQGIDITEQKLNIVHCNKRMNYKDFFVYANKYLNGKIVIYLHTDIYLLNGFKNINKFHLKNKIYALARSNNINGQNTGRGIVIKKIPNKTEKYCCTIDGWCFLSPIPKEILNDLNYYPNTWGGENKLIYTFKKKKYKVICSNLLKLVHLHITDIRPWNKKKQWITKDGNFLPHENRHLFQTEHTVGGGIPIELGSAIMINYL